MRTFKNFLAIILFIALPFCSAAQKLSKADARLIEWFDRGEWHEGIAAKPAPSIDKLEFAHHYAKYPERWTKVFEYLRTQDLMSLPLGRVELSEAVAVNVQEYTTKDPGDQRLEQHNKFIDVQCIVSGSELMGTVKQGNYEVQSPYKEGGDIGFYKSKGITPYYVATSDLFFIFFHDDIHATNIGFGDKTHVRKIVFKVKAD